jgi:hypothetical protein
MTILRKNISNSQSLKIPNLGVGEGGFKLFRHLAAQLLALLRVLPAKVVVFFRRLRKENELNRGLNAMFLSIAKRSD